MQILKYFGALISLISILSNPVLADRLKDLTSLAGVRSNQLVGYGVVVGLAGQVTGILVLHCNQCSRLYLDLELHLK